MAVETVTIVDVMVGGIKVDEFGVSDTLDNYSDAEISDYIYVGANSRMLGGNIDLYANNAGSYDTWQDGMPFNTGTVTGSIMTMKSGDGSYECPAEGRYLGVVLLHNIDNNIYNDYITVGNSDNYVMITEFDAKKFLLDISATLTQIDSTGASSFTDKTNSLYNPSLSSVSFKYNNAGTYIDTAYGVLPYFVLNYGGYLYLISAFKVNQTAIFRCSFRTAPAWNAGTVYYPFSYNDISKSISVAFNGYGFGDHIANISPDDYIWPYGGAGPYYKYSTSDYIIMRTNFGGAGFTCEYYYINYNDMMMMYANSGMYFRINGDTVFKPLIDNNVVYGFTDDLDAESDIDNYDGSTKHDIPVTPPGPPPPPPPSIDDDDNDDPVSTTGAPFSTGLCHYYALTAGSTLLAHISEALGTWDIENTHKDLYKNLVSCKLVKPPAAIPTTGSEAFTIYGVKPQYEGADITLPVVSGNPDASFGPYTIDRKFGDFRDYAPYTRVSIYLPYCGWCDLPSHVVGRQVSVHYYTDIIAATCKAVVFCGNNIIAEAAGVIGLDIPFVADNVGAKMQAVTAGMIAALGGGIQLGAGIGTMVSTKSGSGAKAALSGASQYLSGYSQMAMAFNENTTEISGKNGDGCCLAGATNIIIKIVRPKKGAYTDAPYVPPGYGHNIGFVSQKQVKVSSVSGLLIADNVDTSGISGATEAERAEIKRVLETGLIVNDAPE